MLRSHIVIATASLALSLALSCSNDGAKKRGSSAKAATSSKTSKSKSTAATDDGGDTGDSDSDSGGGEGGGTCLTGGGGFDLQDTGGYEEIALILGPKCASCHLSDASPGGNYTTAAGVKAKAQSIKDRINRTAGAEGAMPPAAKLSAAEIDTIEAWIDAGATLPGGQASTSTSTQSSTSTSASTGTAAGADPCASGGGDVGGGEDDDSIGSGDDTSSTGTGAGNTGVAEGAPPIKEAFEPYVNPEEKKTCHDQGLAFYRDQDETHQYGRCYEGAQWPAAFECNREGVLKAFKNNSQVKTYVDEKDAEGWYYDDCGVLNGKPVVFFACYTKGDGVCVKIDDISTDTLSILGEVLKTGG